MGRCPITPAGEHPPPCTPGKCLGHGGRPRARMATFLNTTQRHARARSTAVSTGTQPALGVVTHTRNTEQASRPRRRARAHRNTGRRARGGRADLARCARAGRCPATPAGEHPPPCTPGQCLGHGGRPRARMATFLNTTQRHARARSTAVSTGTRPRARGRLRARGHAPGFDANTRKPRACPRARSPPRARGCGRACARPSNITSRNCRRFQPTAARLIFLNAFAGPPAPLGILLP